MHPTLFRFHGLELHSYGLLLAIAFLVGIQLFLKATFGEGAKASHLSYIGDAEVSADVNIGAGTITCNYDGVSKHKTVLEDGAFIGSDTQLVAPVRVGVIGVGRIGCFLNGCCFGLPSHAPWAIKFPPGSYSNFVFPDEPLQPSQLYLAAAGVGLFLLLLRMDRKAHFDGWLFWSYIALDAVLRFIIDFTRYYDATSYLGKIGPLAFNVNQVFSVVLILASLFMLRRLKHAPPATEPGIPEASGSTPVTLERAESPAGQDPNA